MGRCMNKFLVSASLIFAIVSYGSASYAQNTDSQLKVGLVQNSLADVANDSQAALNIGDYARAKSSAQSALNNLGKGQTSDEIALRVVLGETYLNEGSFNEAGKELDKAYKLASKSNTETEAYARILDDLSWVYQTQNKFDQAQKYLDEALAVQRKVAPESPELLDILEHAGWINEQKGLYSQATPYFQEALEIRRKKDPNGVPLANDLEHVWSNLYRLGQNRPELYAQALAIKENSNEVFKLFFPHSIADTVVYSYRQGAPNCALGSAGGLLQQSITANQLTIDAAVSNNQNDFAKSARAYVRISNQSNQPVQILMQPPTFIVLKPKIQFISQVASDQLANKIEKKGESKAKWIRFWGSQATQTMTSNVISSGNMVNSYGYFPPAFGYGYGYPYYPAVGGNGMTTVVTNVPDYAAQARAMQRAQEVTAKSAATATDIRETALGPVVVQPGQTIEGSLYFDPVNFNEALLRIPAGNALFEFRFIR